MIPLEEFAAGETVTVWVNGIERELLVPEHDPEGSDEMPKGGRLAVDCHWKTDQDPLAIIALIGKDPIPTGFDAKNTGSCRFNQPVSAIRINITNAFRSSSTQEVEVRLSEPVLEIGLPLPMHLGVPIIDADLIVTVYQRRMWAVGTSGEVVEIQGFPDVSLFPRSYRKRY